MRAVKRAVVLCWVATLISGTASADLMRELARMEGYTIVHAGTVTGYINDDGEKEENTFRGCTHGRKLIIDNRYEVTCREYSYSYAYRPDIVILTNGPNARAIIDEEVYDITL